MTKLLYVLRGVPASGKTTFARAWVQDDPTTRTRVNRDDLRRLLFDRDYPVHTDPDVAHRMEASVTAAAHEAVRALLRSGRDVIVDDTNISARYVRQWAEIAADEGADFTEHVLSVDVETCVQRDDIRGYAGQRAVGAAVIRDMHKRLRSSLRSAGAAPTVDRPGPYVPDVSLPTAWVVDVDGTLANRGDRNPHDLTRVSADTPHLPVVQLVRDLARRHNIVVLSGREETCRSDTEAWLDEHLGDYDALFMRAAGDHRDDAVVKVEILHRELAPRYHVLGTIDDRNRVVRAWREAGLLCCQVAPGAF